MNKHITVAQGGEDALRGLALTERGMGCRDERGVLERGTVHAIDLPQAGQVQQARYLHHITGIHIQLAQEQLEHVLGHIVGDLEPNR